MLRFDTIGARVGLLVALGVCLGVPLRDARAATMNDYCIQPPFVAQVVPPLVTFVTDREHKLYTEAFNDAFDLDDDGRIETSYKHTIDYYGYFDPHKCYTYSTSGKEFNPVSVTADKFCTTGQFSGNILNWMTMSRMDVLRKVLYGGSRMSPDSTTKTTLQRVFIPQDAHAFGKEFTGRLCSNGTTFTNACVSNDDCDSGYTCTDKSVNLLGFAAATQSNNCAYTSAIAWTPANDKVLVVKYAHPNTTANNLECGNSHSDLLNSYEPWNYLSHYYINGFDHNDTTNSPAQDVQPTKDHGADHMNFLAVTEFNASSKGNWMFAIDGDDGAEVEIDGVVVASDYTCHSSCATAPATFCRAGQTGTINLGATGWKRLIVRHSDLTGQDGVRVWYKPPSKTQVTDAWKVFNAANLELRSPIMVAGSECTIKTADFIQTGTPTKGTTDQYHLFCNKSGGSSNDPLLRVLKDKSNRIWDWTSNEVTQCDDHLGAPDVEYRVFVEVCNNTVGLENNCKQYGTGSSATRKPIGLLQKYGDSDGTKVCSKSMVKSCSNDSACRPDSNGGVDLGMCVDKSQMYFGMLSGSFTNNLQGGVLRKNIHSISDEVDVANGFLKTAQNIPSNMIDTFENLKIGDYSGTSYGSCVNHDQVISNGKCRDWGNPLAEMMYETLRYYAGKGVGTTGFEYTTTQDGPINLPHPEWGYRDGNTRTFKGPYDIYPACSKPFVLLLSDIYPNFDADQLPGVEGSSYAEDNVHPLLNLDKSVGGKKLLTKLLDDIGTTEALTNKNWFIGNNGSLYDTLCTSKSVTSFSVLRGLCSEQPTRKGSFYTAALSYYAHSFMKDEIAADTTAGINNNIPNALTFAVALSSPAGNLKVKAGNGEVTIVPVGKSVSGCAGIYQSCASKCTLTATDIFGDGAPDTLAFSNCASGAYCPTNEIVKIYTESVKYDSSGNAVYARFRVNFADAEQGQDYDMDAVGFYEICTSTAVSEGYGTCGTSGVGANQVEVKVVSDYAAGCIDQVLGFVISGTSQDGLYLPVRDKSVGAADGDTPAAVAALPFNWSHIFTATGSATGFLKNPLWYAAKWGGFTDKNSNKIPDQAGEWDADGNGDPDNYYPVVNPLKLERQLEKAFTDILARVSSGTAASILSNNDNNGANLLQAVFFPRKIFSSDTSADWIGEMQALWYYIDPLLNASTIREDSVTDNKLRLKDDKIIRFAFDTGTNQTRVTRFTDANGDGIADSSPAPENVSPDEVNSLWRAGELLWSRNLATSPRTIYTSNGTSRIDFATGNRTTLRPLLQAADDTEADKIINFVHGTDPEPAGYRSRRVTIGNSSGIWRLGDIVSSTPRLLSNVRLNTYGYAPPTGYRDTSYTAFLGSSDYKSRGVAFVGANDGMLHAFKLGTLTAGTASGDVSVVSGTGLGSELWSFIPRNALPYLRYQTCKAGGGDTTYCEDKDYAHLYYVDLSPYLFDASIATTSGTGCTDTAYWNCDKKTTYTSGTSALDYTNTSWRTILISGMGLGGASRNSTTAGTGTFVKTPIDGVGYSSYFALDVTKNFDASTSPPTFLWEFSNPALGYTTVGPAIVRIGESGNNGRWYAVFASGPTGPIDTTIHQFKGNSDQNLKIFIVDLRSGALLRTIDTGIQNAFAGSLTAATLDADRWNEGGAGYFKDDVVYLGYVEKDTTTNTWTKGGVLRILTKENTSPVTTDYDPAQWTVSKVIDGIGPVTSAVSKLQDKYKNLWLYFGSGRFFYKAGNEIDDGDGQRALYGIKEPCYVAANADLNNACTTTLNVSSLVDKTSDASNTALAADKNGWYINLAASTTAYKAQRVITDPVAASNGAVFFTTFKPSGDICTFGGASSLWGVRYDTGGALGSSALQGSALIQVSTGSFVEMKLANAFSQSGGRESTSYQGVPPKSPPAIISNAGMKPVKRVLHIQER